MQSNLANLTNRALIWPTLIALSLSLSLSACGTPVKKIEVATAVGKALAEKAAKAGVEEAAFDRNGYLYHGRVKALADSAREGGLKL